MQLTCVSNVITDVLADLPYADVTGDVKMYDVKVGRTALLQGCRSRAVNRQTARKHLPETRTAFPVTGSNVRLLRRMVRMHMYMTIKPNTYASTSARHTSTGSSSHVARKATSKKLTGSRSPIDMMKPNVSALASEAFVMFSANKTKQWLERKTDFEKNSLIQDAMKNVSLVRANYKRMKEEIEANQRRKVEESIREAEAIEYRRLNRLEGYTQKMIYYGLWQTEDEVDSALKEISTKKETMEALKAQLNFRKHVLKQDPKNKENLYLLSKKVPGYPEYFNITYEGDTSVYVYRLLEDYRIGDLRVLVQ
ncbi:hypothetical protein MAR_000488 [Mya arenaria]|uniref:Uncharacterized protein n=1 Tax=Mya arenaria TaxID=6604 RepID=A0ABY7F8Y6_MYAAR|nr:hypothetical protein MAR_000488 [Mya arenaria]